MSPYRALKISDLNKDGKVGKPVVAETSQCYRKAQLIVKERNMRKSHSHKVEATKVHRHRGITRIHGGKMLRARMDKLEKEARHRLHLEKQQLAEEEAD